MSDSFKVWITKYALTQGIFEVEVEFPSYADVDNDKNYVKVVKNQGEGYFGEGKDWHRTKESAIKRAEKMKMNKIANVEKQLEKLKKMKFE